MYIEYNPARIMRIHKVLC